MNLHEEIISASWLKAQILAAFPDMDEQTLSDTIEGQTNITEALAMVIRSAEEDRVMAAALKIRITEMQERADRLDIRIDKKREIVSSAMDRCGIKRITQSDFTATLSAGSPKVVITDETQLPKHVFVPQPPRLDKKAVAGLLKEGASVPGTTLSNAQPHLTIRRS